MPETMLRTKLVVPPVRPTLVPRPHLVDRLSQGRDRRLTLVSAPAGYGKTTLVSSWMAGQLESAWLSLDEGDNAPGQFWQYFIAAIRTVYPEFGADARQISLTTEPAGLKALLIRLLNEIEERALSLVLVLDDYHAIESTAVHQSLDYFLEYMPAAVHLVLLTRIDPPLALGRLRANGDLIEIRSSDLQFTEDETAGFLKQVMNLDLPQDQVGVLKDRTEGWAAGLQMAGLSMRRMKHPDEIAVFVDDFAGSNRHILDYLTDEVLARQTAATRTFLLQTSILDRFNASLCEAVTGEEDSQQVLEFLESANLFLFPLDENRTWYRFHHLFATLLQHRLAKHPKEERDRLHGLAAAWFESREMPDLAIKNYKEADNLNDLARLIKEYGADSLQPGQLHLLKQWLEALPLEQVQNDAWLASLQAWAYLFEQQFEPVATWVAFAMDALPESVKDPEAGDMQLWGSIVALQSWLASQQGEFARAIKLAEKALDVLPETPPLWRGKVYIFLGEALAGVGHTADALAAYEMSLQYNSEAGNWITASAIMAGIWMSIMLRGRLNEARAQYDRVISTVTTLGQPSSATILRMARVAILYEQNELDAVGPELADLWKYLKYDASEVTLRCRYLLSVYQLAIGAREAAYRTLLKLEQGVLSWTASYEQALAMGRIMRVHLRLGYVHRVRRWRRTVEIDPDNLTLLHIEEYLAAADLMRFDESALAKQDGLALLGAVHRLCDDAGMVSIKRDVYCLQALLAAAVNDEEMALEAIRQALTGAESEGFVRTFIDFGQPMAGLLENAISAGVHPGYARFLLGQCAPESPLPGADQGQGAIAESLSARELEVLALLATHLTGPEMASQLSISTNTLKTHTKNIYGKLGVNNRNDAVVKARTLGLI